MAPKIFITGVTGYIGGDTLYALNKAHPEYEITALVRNPDKGGVVAAEYSKIQFAYGTLEDSEVLEEEAGKADIVIHTADASDHEGAAKAIAKGLLKGHTAERPGYWLHTGGTGILCWKDMRTETYGEPPSEQPYDDLERVDDLTSLPDDAFHRNIDKIVLAAGNGNPSIVKTAIVCPPTIYGAGRGPGNKRSRQVYNLVEATLKNRQAPMLGKGLTEWDDVHVHDLADLFVLLCEAATSDKANDSELWGEKGYFLAQGGHHVWGAVSKWVGEEAYKQGFIKTKEVKGMCVEEAKDTAGFEALSWGLNSKGFAKRAHKFLGWAPKGKSLKETIPEIVAGEAKLQGLCPGHAEKASGAK